MHKADDELGFHEHKWSEFMRNLKQLDEREEFMDSNLKGLIRYAKKLTSELEAFKEKVGMAEKIIADLRSSGNESLDSLLLMLHNYKVKEEQTHEEILRLRQLVLVKDDEIQGLDTDIDELTDYISTAKENLDNKINDAVNDIEANNKVIRRQDKLIVDLQQKNEIAQSKIDQTTGDKKTKEGERNAMRIKAAELGHKKADLLDTIQDLERKVTLYKTMEIQREAEKEL